MPFRAPTKPGEPDSSVFSAGAIVEFMKLPVANFPPPSERGDSAC